jgi:SAM-dependent methyltransferase
MLSLIWPGPLAAQAIYCAARLGIADLLWEGVNQIDALAAATHAHPRALVRLLRALCSLDVLRETADGCYALTEMGMTLRSEDASDVKAWATMLGAPFVWRPWGRLLESIQTGQSAFDRIFGRPFDELVAISPEDARMCHAAISAVATRNVPAILAAYDFSPFHRIVDVGSGSGTLLRAILEAYRNVYGVLFDAPEAVAQAGDMRNSPVGARCQVVAGDVLEGVPAGADAYLLTGTLHRHDDHEALTILRHVRHAIQPAGRLLVVDSVAPSTSGANAEQALVDLMMLPLVPEYERTETEFRALLSEAGFQLARVVCADHRHAILEGIPG